MKIEEGSLWHCVFEDLKKNVLTKHENFVSIFTKNNGSFKVQTNNVQSTTLLQKRVLRTAKTIIILFTDGIIIDQNLLVYSCR